MNEQIIQQAESIKTLLAEQIERGADQVMDFVQRFAADKQTEDAVVMLKFDLATAESVEEKAEIADLLRGVLDKVVANYNPEKVAAQQKREATLKQAYEHLQVPNDVVLRAENILKSYPNSNFNLELDNLELRLGEITGLVGENATGKTTLLRILAGDLAQDSGSLNYPFFNPEGRLSWAALKMRIAFVPQDLPAWQGSLSENLRYEAARHGVTGKANREALQYIIQRLGLALHLDKSWHELSGGYKLRFALAKALIWQAQLLIIDEPLAYLDIKTQLTVLTDLRNLAKSLRHPMAILVSSQHLHEIEAVADQLLFMREGRLENLGATALYNKNRSYNTFELTVDCPFQTFTQALSGFAHIKVWSNGMTIFVTAAPLVSGFDLLSHLNARSVEVLYFRNISRSVKTKFYEEQTQ